MVNQVQEVVISDISLKLKVKDGVAHFTQFSRLLAEYSHGLHCQRAIDFGCGSGAQAMFLLKRGARLVYAVDIEESCVEAALETAELNGILPSDNPFDGLVVLKAAGLRGLAGSAVNLIVSNPPTMPSFEGVPRWADGGIDGRSTLDILLREGPLCLAEGGSILVVHSSLCGINRTLELAHERGLVHAILGERVVPFRHWYYPCLPKFKELASLYDCRWEEADGRLFERVYVILLTKERRRDERFGDSDAQG